MLPELHQHTMAPKRTCTEADLLPVRTRPCDSKRSKMVGNVHANPCETASLVTEASATSSSDMSEDDDSTSDDSDSSDEEDDREGNPSIPQASGPIQKPAIDPHHIMAYAKELRDRLQAFLPQLQNANRELASNAAELNMETVDDDDDEQHIEMDLGLGVLEQQRDDQNSSLAEMPSVSDLISGGQRLAEGSIQVVATETDAAD
jgi:hypothetical protein